MLCSLPKELNALAILVQMSALLELFSAMQDLKYVNSVMLDFIVGVSWAYTVSGTHLLSYSHSSSLMRKDIGHLKENCVKLMWWLALNKKEPGTTVASNKATNTTKPPPNMGN